MAERKTTKNKKSASKGRMSLAEVRAAAAAKAAAEKAAGRRAKSKKTPAERMAAPVRKQAAKVKQRPTIRKKIAAQMADAAAERAAEAQKAPEPFFKPPAKKTVRFSAADLEDFRKELLYMRGRIAAKIKSDNQASFKREDESHHAEESTEAYERFFAIETSGSFQEIIYHIDEALNSIKEGTYGICKNCGGLIQKPRLQALPFAKNCIRCQSLHERRK
jgi:RNA polymerase-binding protein DksA